MSSVSGLTNNTPIPLARQWTNESFISFWKRNSTHYANLGESDAKVHSVAYRVIGGLFAAMAVSVLILGACSIAVAGHTVIIPLSILVSVFSFWRAMSIEKDQEASQLELIQKDVKYLPLPQIARRYSWSEIFGWGILTQDEFADAFRAHIKTLPILKMCAYYEKIVQRLEDCPRPKYTYSIPLPSEFRDKWYTETQNKTLEEIIQQYPLEILKKHNIISGEEGCTLQGLKSLYEQAENQRQAAIKALDERSFPELRSSQITLQQAHRKIDQEYENHPAVKRLKVIDSEWGDCQAEIRNRCVLKKEQAFTQCARFLEKRGVTHYKSLNTQDGFQYEALHQQYLLSADQIEKTAQDELLKVNEQYGQEKEYLSSEVHQLRQRREANKSRAAEANPSLIGSRQRDRQVSLLPIQERFRKIVIDLNAQYIAHRSIGGNL
jgi:hypothetical protein